MKNYLFVFGFFAMLLVAGCSSGVKEDSGNSAQVPAVTGDSGIEETAEAPVAPEVKTFTMTAKQWEFSPDTITVNKGDTVVLSVKSIDVTHGFAIPEFGVNERLTPGKTVEVEFVADKAGTFPFFCSVVCGEGHGSMRGQLVVSQ